MADSMLRSQASNNWRQRDAPIEDSRIPYPYGRQPPAEGWRTGASPRREQQWRSQSKSSAIADKQQVDSLVEASNALEEGRRIYMGNILYNVRPEEITQALKDNGFPAIDQVHISVDPVTGRNPGYCFVEFLERQDADNAIDRMKGVTIRGRPLKTGPCQPKGREKRWQRSDHTPAFSRWGNWDPEGGNVRVDGQGPTGAEEHLTDVVRNWKDNRSRVFVGGLGKMINQGQNQEEMRRLFKGFNVVAISKRITAHENTRLLPGKHNYVFVDLESKEEAERAIRELHGMSWDGSRIKVRVANELPPKIEERAVPLGMEREQYFQS